MRKVLVVNKYHFISGGAERYFFSIMKALRERGIEPIPLSVRYPKTVPSPYEKYFIEPVIRDGAAKIVDQKVNFRQQAALAMQAIYNHRAAEAVKRIAQEHEIDLAYFLNFNNHISPSAIDACHGIGIPVVMRMSDFNLTCASNMFYRDGRPCTACKGGLHHAVVNRCVHGSLVKSLAAVTAMAVHRASGIYKKVSAFVAPTEFMRRELIELGFDPRKIFQINTFAQPQERGIPDPANRYILFIGRFAPYKGPDIAMRAFAKMKHRRGLRLLLAGDEGDQDAARLRSLAAQLECPSIEFLPFQRDKSKIIELIQKSLFVVVPSENYENLPNTLLEAFSCGRPVISTRLGSIPDIVRDLDYGLLYEFGNADDFAAKMDRLVVEDQERERMGANAHRALLRDYTEEGHLEKVLSVFSTVAPAFQNMTVDTDV